MYTNANSCTFVRFRSSWKRLSKMSNAGSVSEQTARDLLNALSSLRDQLNNSSSTATTSSSSWSSPGPRAAREGPAVTQSLPQPHQQQQQQQRQQQQQQQQQRQQQRQRQQASLTSTSSTSSSSTSGSRPGASTSRYITQGQTQTTLQEHRQLFMVLDMISSREKASEDDLVATLSHFLKKNQTIAKLAVEKAELNMHKVLSPEETTDLKLLLRLPMNKLKAMRTFLTNKGIPILASDPQIYKVLGGRRDFTDETIEVSTLRMKKTVGAAEKSKISYVRVKSLENHITDLLTRHIHNGNMKEHQEFCGDIWIKIGGDKGGTSTKLCVQITNVKNPNSPETTDLLAFFEATDSDENMRLVFSIYTEMMERMQRPEFEFILGPEFENTRCRIFVFGDYEWLCKTLGHLGANSTYPCLWCKVKLEALRKPNGLPHSPKVRDEDGKWVDREGWPEERTIEEMEGDLEANKAYSEDHGGDTKTNSSKYHSIHKDPILPIKTSIEHIVPPVLHIMLGLVQRYFNLLEQKCKEMDRGTLEGMDGELNEQWERLSVETRENEVECEHAAGSLEFEELILQGFRKSSQGDDGGGASEPCAMPACSLACVNPWEGQPRQAVRDKVKYFQCYECGDGPGGDEGWYHLTCVGLGDEEYMNEEFQFMCPVCKGEVGNAGDVVRKQVKKVAKQKKEVQKTKVKFDNSKKQLDSVYQEVVKQRGPKEKRLNEILEDDLKVKRQAYHSQCFVGNHCQIILKKHEELLAVLDGNEEKQKYNTLFFKLYKIFCTGYMRAAFLTPDEVDEVCDLCYEFGVWFPTTFVGEKLTPKFHMLVCAVPRCAIAWRTLGLLSEHGLESVHAAINQDERIYCRVRDNEKRLSLVFKQHGQYAMADRSILKTKKRVCQSKECSSVRKKKGRYVTIEGIRQCKVCHFVPDDTL